MTSVLVLGLAMAAAVPAAAQRPPETVPPTAVPAETGAESISLFAPDPYTLVGPRHFVNDYSAVRGDGTINVVVEIPAGTNAKWEVDKEDGMLRWELEQGRPRVVQYLGYPGNYGMVPRTLLPAELGGDGDPLDVLVLGPASSRGAVVTARVIGVLRLLDDGELDDKLLAVMDGSPLDEVDGLEELEEGYPGILTIVETWFVNYKGADRIESKGYADAAAARETLSAAMAAFERRQAEKGGRPPA